MAGSEDCDMYNSISLPPTLFKARLAFVDFKGKFLANFARAEAAL